MSDMLSFDPLFVGNVLLDIVPHSFEVEFRALSPEALRCRRRATGGVSARVQWVVNAENATPPPLSLARNAEHGCNPNEQES